MHAKISFSYAENLVVQYRDLGEVLAESSFCLGFESWAFRRDVVNSSETTLTCRKKREECLQPTINAPILFSVDFLFPVFTHQPTNLIYKAANMQSCGNGLGLGFVNLV